MATLKIAVLISGAGSTLQNLIYEIESGRLDAGIGIVIASRPGIRGLERAAEARLPNFVVDRHNFDSPSAFSKSVFALLDDAGIELVCLAGWLWLLEIPPNYAGRMMNIHPALLPSFGGPGMYGQRVHQAVLDHGCKVSGCTVHFLDGEYDHGPIILQRTCPVHEDDTTDSLAQRVFTEEKIAYPQAIRLFAEKRLKLNGRRVTVQ